MVDSLRSAEHKFLIGHLKEARRKAGISQQVLASSLGKPQSFVAKVENGDRNISAVELFQMSKFLDVDLSQLALDTLKVANSE